MTEKLSMWTVYDHPKDFPDKYVARCWLVTGTWPPEPSGELLTCGSLDVLREVLRQRGLTCLDRSASDDPVIIETWV